MAKYGSNSVVVAFDDAAGDAQTMTQYVQEINGIDVEAMLEESHTFGDAWFESLASGLRKVSGDITLGGLYDDTSTTGPDAIFNAPASGPSVTTRTLTITFGGSKTFSVECFIKKYSRPLSRGKLHRYTVALQSTGAVTEA